MFPKRCPHILLLSALCVFAGPPATLSQSDVRHWGSGQGLPEENIYSISETKDGHLWLASRDGLIRFDGLNFKVFNPGETSGFRDSGLGGAVTAGDALWVGGRDYLAYAVPDAFQSFTNLRFLCTAIPRDPQDRYGVAGMQLIDGDTILYRRAEGVYRASAAATGQPPEPLRLYLKSPNGEPLTGFHHGPSGNWAATASGLYRHVAGHWAALPGPSIRSATVLEDRKGILWALAADGLFAYDGRAFRKFPINAQISSDPYRALFQDKDGDVWVGLIGAIARLRNGKVEVIRLEQRMRSGDFVRVIFQSRDHAIWAATNWGTLIRIDSPVFHTIGVPVGIGEAAISAVVRDGADRTWIGTRSRGIYFQDHQGFHRLPQTAQGNLHAVALVGDRTLLFATVMGLWLNTPSGTTILARASDNLTNHYRSLSPNYQSHIYYSDSESIFRIPLPITHKPKLEKIASLRSVRSMLADSTGLWAVSWETGLNHISPGGKVTQFPIDPNYELHAFTLFELSPGYFLVGSSGGAFLFDRHKRRFIAARPLFERDQIFQIIDDGRSHIWFAGRRALLAAGRRALLEYAGGQRASILPLRLTGQQGLSSSNFGLGTSSGAFLDKQHTLWLASIGGVIYFQPSQLVGNNESLPCAISQVLADGVSIPAAGSIELKPAVRRLEIKYEVLNREAANNPIFRYRFANEDWIETNRSQAEFTNPAPGNHKFDVQARLASNEWSSLTSMDVHIPPQWFQRPIVQVSGITLGIGLLALWIRIRDQRIKAHSLELEERVRARTEELARARDEAQAATRVKADFLAAMSHEIRTPMNGVVGMVEALLETPLTSDQRSMLAVVSQSGEALIRILNDILDFSKIDAGKLTIEQAPFHINELARYCKELFLSKAQEKGLLFELEIAPGVPDLVRGDSGHLRQILLNLLSNAIKFTMHGRVRLDVRVPRPGFVSFVVSDTGIGIPADKIEAIFSAFTQAESSTTRRYGGTGLGLTISQRLALAMNGTLEVNSLPGQGSVFTLTLPLPLADAPDAHSANAQETPAVTLPNLEVLVVEDNAVNRQVAARLLHNLGCNVTLANDGRQGVAIAAEKNFDVILMDCHMPVMDGYEATRRIRTLQNEHGTVPIVALTADALSGDRQRCLDAGMNDFLTKPVRSTDLRRLLEALAEK